MSSVIPPDPAALEARSAFMEVLAGFVAALAAGVAASLLDDKTVSHRQVQFLFWSGFLLWAGVVLLLAFSYARIAKQRRGTPPPTRLVSTASRLWVILVVAATTLVGLLTALTFYQGAKADPDFSSVYDGQDSLVAECEGGSEPVPEGTTEFLDFEGKRVGTVQLIVSPLCGTMWAVVNIDAAERQRLKGAAARIEMERPEDGDVEPYPLPLRGGPSGRSNMISAVEACVQAKVFLTMGERRGPDRTTPCKRM